MLIVCVLRTRYESLSTVSLINKTANDVSIYMPTDIFQFLGKVDSDVVVDYFKRHLFSMRSRRQIPGLGLSRKPRRIGVSGLLVTKTGNWMVAYMCARGRKELKKEPNILFTVALI